MVWVMVPTQVFRASVWRGKLLSVQCVLLKEDDKNCPKQDGEGVAEAVEHLDFMGQGAVHPVLSKVCAGSQ